MALLTPPDECLTVKIPVIKNFRLLGRNRPSIFAHTFHPPASVHEWPKTTAHVGDWFLRLIVKDWLYGVGAIGIIVDGKVYTNDLPFWLSLVKSGETYRIAYDLNTASRWQRFSAKLRRKFRRHDQDSQYHARPVALEFVDIDKWERLKQEPFWAWYYRSKPAEVPVSDSNQHIHSDAPPAYSYICPKALTDSSERLDDPEESQIGGETLDNGRI